MPEKKNIKPVFTEPYSDLLKGCLAKSRSAQQEMYEKLVSKMYPVCMRYIGERERAKDVMHDGFITLFNRLEDFRGEGSFEGWARRIFVTACLMHLRKNDVLKNSEQIDGEVPVQRIKFETLAVDKIDAEKLMETISRMPAGFRVVFNMYVIEGYSHKEIAEKLGLSEGGSRSQLSRAKVWLQNRLTNTKGLK